MQKIKRENKQKAIPVRSLMMARSGYDILRRLARQRLWVALGGEPTRCDATCQRKVVPYQDWDTIPHPMPRCNGLEHFDERRCVEGSQGMSNSLSIFQKTKTKQNQQSV
jgi:hypothetical protein